MFILETKEEEKKAGREKGRKKRSNELALNKRKLNSAGQREAVARPLRHRLGSFKLSEKAVLLARA